MKKRIYYTVQVRYSCMANWFNVDSFEHVSEAYEVMNRIDNTYKSVRIIMTIEQTFESWE